ncbi:MAG: phosphohydrolase [Clostridia bacterium]|nr:phosphohydrolase [Clostridia bacterium]
MQSVIKSINDARRRSRLMEMRKFTQHGDTDCMLHTAAVAYYSIRLAAFIGIKIHKSELIRGALLHDYFLYDWHDGKRERKIHGFTHPSAALKNAMEDFELTAREKDIIKKHMFPLTPAPPKYRESIIVCLVDKGCSLYETFKRRNSYSLLRSRLSKII